MRGPSQITAAGETFDRPMATVEAGGETYRIMRHPELWITGTAKEFLRDYNHSDRSNQNYNTLHPCWVDMKVLYEAVRARIERSRKRGK